mmetsp:Transcript_12399/g.31256  ORF Transcript_12399/g.31256 Transcript_12399/m.31256 type:complete len:132 (+) Transcript_12399:68-463(+)
MDEVDYVANRVGALALSGFFGGAAYATLKGFPRRTTALKAAASCAIVGTSLFAAERFANVLMRDQIKESNRLYLSSYAFGGVFGGALNGLLYQNQPIRGMVVFTPFMLGIGIIELELKRRRQIRFEEIRDE